MADLVPTKHFMASVLVAFVLLSALAYEGAPQRVVTGTIRESKTREWLTVATHTMEPKGFPIALRKTTIYEGNHSALKPGNRVTVWYRGVGERHFVADRVRVLSVP